MRQMIRVSLFARATVVFRNPLRASSLFSHRPKLSSRFFMQRITDRAPWMINVLRLRLPFFVTEDNICFPPELCCRGTRPHHADSSLPLENCTASTSLINAAAISGPTPGIVNKWRYTVCCEDAGAYRNNKPRFSEQSTKLVSQRGSLLNHQLTGIPKRFDILLFFGFNWDKVNTRTTCCFTDCQSIICIIFLASDKRFNMLGWNKFYVISHRVEGSAPEMRS